MYVSPRTDFVKRSTSAWKGKSCYFPVTAKVESGVGILWYLDFKEALDCSERSRSAILGPFRDQHHDSDAPKYKICISVSHSVMRSSCFPFRETYA